MGRWLAEFQENNTKPDRQNTDITDNTCVTSVMAVVNPTFSARNKVEILRLYSNQEIKSVLGKIVQDLPISFDEIKRSPLFNEQDLKMIAIGKFGLDELRLYVGSWVLADGQFPFVLHADWEKKLLDRGQR